MAVSKVRKRKKADPVFPRAKAMALAYKVSRAETAWEAIEAIQTAVDGLPVESDWVKWGRAVLAYLKGETKRPPLQVIKKDGNKKVPFFLWSVLPIFMCPGAGACAKVCYSLKAWRYPAAYFRQIQNTYLFRFQRELIADLVLSLPQGVTVRLFVDGDFDSLESIEFWFKVMRLRPDLQFYGYSKSWDELYAYNGIWPDNYLLNLSSGGKVRTVTKAMMAELPISRGEFLMVPVDSKWIDMGNDRYDQPGYHQNVRESARAMGYGKVLSCPGKCGECVKGQDGKNQHACGDRRLFSLPIANGVH